jgi:hypothetical protein
MRFGGVPSNHVSATQRFFDSPKNEVKNKTAKSEAYWIYCKIIFRCLYKFFFLHSTQPKRETRKCDIFENNLVNKEKKNGGIILLYSVQIYFEVATPRLYCTVL